jgi:hypothetical protein
MPRFQSLKSDSLLGISFFIPSAPFPPKARGRRGFDVRTRPRIAMWRDVFMMGVIT